MQYFSVVLRASLHHVFGIFGVDILSVVQLFQQPLKSLSKIINDRLTRSGTSSNKRYSYSTCILPSLSVEPLIDPIDLQGFFVVCQSRPFLSRSWWPGLSWPKKSRQKTSWKLEGKANQTRIRWRRRRSDLWWTTSFSSQCLFTICSWSGFLLISTFVSSVVCHLLTVDWNLSLEELQQITLCSCTFVKEVVYQSQNRNSTQLTSWSLVIMGKSCSHFLTYLE